MGGQTDARTDRPKPICPLNFSEVGGIKRNITNTVKLQWLEHCWLIYHGCFELVIEPLGKSPIAADSGQFRVIFYVENGILCVLIRIASMRRF